jgi:hypothetical protein
VMPLPIFLRMSNSSNPIHAWILACIYPLI